MPETQTTEHMQAAEGAAPAAEGHHGSAPSSESVQMAEHPQTDAMQAAPHDAVKAQPGADEAGLTPAGPSGAAHATDHAPAAHDGAAPAHADAAHAGAAHGGHKVETSTTYLPPQEVPNIATLVEAFATKPGLHEGQRHHPSEYISIGGREVIPINPLFTLFYMLCFLLFVRKAFARPNLRKPGKLQNFAELFLGGLWNFFEDVLGKENKKYIPWVATLWIYIFLNNITGLIPGFKAPSSSAKTTFAIGILTFFWVQGNALRAGGFKKWFFHLMGSPTEPVMWVMMPLFLVLHTMGELIKPVSLSLRLFGNIFGEDKLLAAFLGMGMAITAGLFGTPNPIVGVPLDAIFYPLVVIGSTVQATVFSLLSAIYILLLLPHDEHDHAHVIEHDAPNSIGELARTDVH